MKKNLKRIMALSLAGLMSLSSFSLGASAAELSDADKVAKIIDLEVIVGEGDGIELDQNLTRYRAFTMLIRLLGKQAELDDFTYDENSPTFADANDEGVTPFVQKLMAYLKAHPEIGVVGYEDGTLGAYEEISSKEYARVLVEALGYEAGVDYDWNTVSVFAHSLGLVDSASDLSDDKVTVEDIALLTYETLTQNAKGESVSLGEKLGYDVLEDAELAVDNASAANLIQLVVEFNHANYDEDDVEDLDNYTFEDEDGDEIAFADASLDGTELVLTLEEAVANQSEGTLTIDEAITGEELEFEINFFDTTIPTVTGAKVVGNDTIKVTFSEPIDFDMSDDTYASSSVEETFSLNDGEYFVKSVMPMNNNTEANVEFYTNFDSADYTISIENDLEDYAGFNVVPKSIDLSVTEDEDAPVLVGYKEVTPTKITLIFDEDIEVADNGVSLDVDKFFHTNSSNHATTAEIVNGNEIELTFDSDYELPNGTAYVYVDDEAIQDLWDNVNEQRLYIAVDVDADETAPEVKEVEASAQDELTITYNEELDEDSAETRSNYTLVDEDGDEVDINSADLQANDDGDLVEVVLTLGDEIYGDYVLTVEDVEDSAGNAMAKDTFSFFVDDETAPSFSDFGATLYDVDEDIYTIVVDFDEEMSVSGKYSVLDLEKYEINNISLADIDSDNINISAIDNQTKVRIEIEADNNKNLVVDGSSTLVIARVADAAGNYTAALASSAMAINTASTVSVDTVEAVDNNKLEITLDGKVVDFEANDFIVTTTDGSITLTAAGAKINNSGDDSVITITLDDAFELSDNAQYNGHDVRVITAADNIGTENSYGEPVYISDSDADGIALDKINPELAERQDADGDDVDDVATGTDTVILTFTEAIDSTTVSRFSFSVDDIKVVSVSVSGNVVTLHLDADDSDDPELGTKVTQELAIYDMAGNAISGISTHVEFAE